MGVPLEVSGTTLSPSEGDWNWMAGSDGGGVVPVHTLISLRKNQSMLSSPVNDI